MRKGWFIFCTAVMLLAGCTEKVKVVVEIPRDVEVPEEIPLSEEEMTKILPADPAKFHFVVDWLTETEVVYVEKENGFYLLNSFDLQTGEKETLYEDASIIIDALIHPSKKYILLHTSVDASSATIKIVTTDGTVYDEIKVASTELGIEWNDMDPSLILLTAFHQDWTFDLFLYNGKKEVLKILPIDDPFPKWLGIDTIAYSDMEGHLLDGGEIHTYSLGTEIWGQLNVSGVVYFDTYEDSILFVQINKDGDASYTIKKKDGIVQSAWRMPAISNYSEWVFPDIEWHSSDTLFLTSPETGGQLDELTSPYRLVRVTAGQQDIVTDEFTEGILRCSPSGQNCLTGYSAENLIDVKKKTQTTWLMFPK
ncbi:MAG: hypothetical protein ABS920_02050 [Sporosarcina sp.]